MAPRFSMIGASLSATGAELRADYAIASRSGDPEHTRDIQAKLDHLANLHWQILGRPINAARMPAAGASERARAKAADPSRGVGSLNIASALARLPNSHSSSIKTPAAFLPDAVSASAARAREKYRPR